MKYFIACMSFLFLTSCTTKKQDSKELIDDFITKIFKSDSYTLEDIETFMIPEYFEKKQTFSEKNLEIHISYLTELTKKIRKRLRENNFEYELASKDSDFYKNYKNVTYCRKGELFFMVSKGEPFACFVVENGKLYSFCVDIYLYDKENFVPYFFFDRTKL